MRQIFTLLLILPSLVLWTQGQHSVSYGNAADHYQNAPKQILQIGKDSFFTFTYEKCNPIQIYLTIGEKTERKTERNHSAEYARYKQRGDEWAAMFQTSFDDAGIFPGLLFMHGKRDGIESSLTDEENSFFENGNHYNDFTFYDDQHFLCLPQYRIVNNVAYPPLPYWYIVNFKGVVTDSVAAWVEMANRIDRFNDYWVVGSGSHVYVFLDNFQLLWDKEINAYDRCYEIGDYLVLSRSSSFDVLNKADGSILFHKENVKSVNQNTFGSLVWLEEDQVMESDVSNGSFTFSSQATLDQRDNFMDLVNGSSNMYFMAGTEPEYHISEFRSYFNNQMPHELLPDVAIEIEKMYLDQDTFMLHIVGSDTLVEYKQTIQFELHITNHSDTAVKNVVVYSDIIGAINCGIGYFYKSLPYLASFETVVIQDTIDYHFNPNEEFCFYIPSIDDKPDLDKSDNKHCRQLTATNNLSTTAIHIRPNPASAEVNIQGLSGKFQVNIFTNEGRSILRSQNQVSIDITSLTNGLYWMEIQNGRQLITKKLVVMR